MYSLIDTLVFTAAVLVLYMSAWFVLGVILKRRDIADVAWGPGFVVAAFTAYGMRNNDSWVGIAALLLVTLWGIRLFVHIGSRFFRKKQEDYRYQQLGGLGTFRQWVRTYLTVFLLQGGLILLVSMPVVAIMNSTTEPSVWLAIAGLSTWLFGIVLEAVSDHQLKVFLRSNKGVMQTGLWRYSRHPNYFGELTAWWGAAAVAIAFGQWWGLIGALVITHLIVNVSGLPLLEKKYASNPEFRAYAKRTPKLVPFIGKRT